MATRYIDGTFRGDAAVTRAEFVTIASKFGNINLSGGASFSDVQGHWATDSIKTTFNNGWISGYPNGTFGPNRMITRAEAAVVINKIISRNLSSAQNGSKQFKDLTGNEWYYKDIFIAANGI